MNNQDWKILHNLYLQKNITKTAEALYMTQPAITIRLKKIEEYYDTKLVYRGRKGVHFTPQGEYLAKSANEILAMYEKIKENTWDMDSEVVGTIKVGVSNFITKFMLFEVIRLFKLKYPKVDFQISTGWSKDMFDLIYNKDVHVSFIRGDYGWQDCKHLLFEETICIASNYKMDLDDLPNQPRIDYHTDVKLREMIVNWWTENYASPPQIAMVVDNTDTCKEMLVNNLGYGILPSLVVRNMDMHKIDLIDRSGKPIVRRSWMLYHEETLNLKLIHAFVTFIEENNLDESVFL